MDTYKVLVILAALVGVLTALPTPDGYHHKREYYVSSLISRENDTIVKEKISPPVDVVIIHVPFKVHTVHHHHFKKVPIYHHIEHVDHHHHHHHHHEEVHEHHDYHEDYHDDHY